MRSIWRFVVPVNAEEHAIKAPWANQNPTRVDAIDPRYVEFWCEVDTSFAEFERLFSVIGSGYPIGDGKWTDGWSVVGTTQRVEGLVWHLIEEPQHGFAEYKLANEKGKGAAR